MHRCKRSFSTLPRQADAVGQDLSRRGRAGTRHPPQPLCGLRHAIWRLSYCSHRSQSIVRWHGATLHAHLMLIHASHRCHAISQRTWSYNTLGNRVFPTYQLSRIAYILAEHRFRRGRTRLLRVGAAAAPGSIALDCTSSDVAKCTSRRVQCH